MKNFLKQIVTCLILWGGSSVFASESPRFCIISPGYNTANYYQELIESVTNQDYHNWHMVVIDDHSSDNGVALIDSYIKKHHLAGSIKLVVNSQNMGATANVYNNIYEYCHDEEVAVYLEGDDMLANSSVLSLLAKIYQDDTVWVTYGNFDFYVRGKKSWERVPGSVCNPTQLLLHEPNSLYEYIKYTLSYLQHKYGYIKFCSPGHEAVALPAHIWERNLSRDYTGFPLSHLKTFKVWLFKKINKADLIYDNVFFKSSADAAIMYPLAEMASAGHIQYVPEAIYLYRQTNNNDHKIHARRQKNVVRRIHSLPKYALLLTR